MTAIPTDARALRATLGLDDGYRKWTQELDAFADAGPVDLPPAGPDLSRLLDRLAVPAVDRPQIVALRDEVNAPGSALRVLLERCTARLAASRGSLSRSGGAPDLPAALGAAGRYFHVFVFLAAVPAVRAYHRALGVPDDIGWASLADLGNKLGVYRRTFGTGGFDKQLWMNLPFRGVLYRLGRLQFNLGTHSDGEPGLAAHIPEGGAMDPAACDASLAAAGEFFPRHFPEFLRTGAVDGAADRTDAGTAPAGPGAAEGAAGQAGGAPRAAAPGAAGKAAGAAARDGVRVSCHSWLLDPQLAEYLPAESNILRFQRRWTLPDGEAPEEAEPDGHGLTAGDRAIVEFVFRRMVTTPEQVAELADRASSRLERGVLAHLAAGRHWQGGHGYLTVGRRP